MFQEIRIFASVVKRRAVKDAESFTQLGNVGEMALNLLSL